MSLKESGEMYLETIHLLLQRSGRVRAVDVAEEMHFTRASVSRGLHLLRTQALIEVDADGHITLTESGRLLAEEVAERHRVLTQMLVSLGVSPETAAEDACRMEHVISAETFSAIKAHLKEVQA